MAVTTHLQVAAHRRAFGEDLAILSAVALLNHSYGLVAKNYAALTPRQWPMLLPRISLCRRLSLGKPEHAVLDAREQRHPDVECPWRQFVTVVEGGEDKSALRQPD